MQGNNIIAKSLKQQGLQYCFGIVGIPVIELANAIQAEGVNYYGFRNEQSASYSAQAIGYITGKPGICLTVSGPGMVHAMAGITNAWSNGFPLLVISGASDISQDGKGGFQECNQLGLAQQYCKFSHRIQSVKQIPHIIEKAVKYSIQGRPGPVYLEFPGDILSSTIEEEQLYYPPKHSENIQSIAPFPKIQQSIELLQQATNPLIIIGKGAQMARAEQPLLEFINQTQIPFLPTPMGKGLVSDNHPNCVAPARSTALSQADVILLAGARLNWILHFGQPPRFKKGVKIIQIDVCPEEFDTNLKGHINLLGDCNLIMQQLVDHNRRANYVFPKQSQWRQTLTEKIEKNRKISQKLMLSQKLPMTHYSSLHIINQNLPRQFFYVGEGANTMDIGRTVIPQTEPRTKLDAGTYGTMGIGIPYAMAAQIAKPDVPVVAILGDSAFGFSAMEIETAARYNLPLIIFILNNNGIFFGHEEMPDSKLPINLAPNNLGIETRYEKMAEAFGGQGIFVKTHTELNQVCKKVFSQKNTDKKLTIINVMIDPYGERKPQQFNWLTKENNDQKQKPKL